MDMKMRQDESYRKILQTIPDIVYEIDPDGKFIYLNDSIHKLGFKEEDLIGQHFSVLIHPDDLEHVRSSHVLPSFSGKITGEKFAPQLFDEKRTGKRITKNLRVRLLANEKSASQKSYECEVIAMGLYSTKAEEQKALGTLGIIRDPIAAHRSEQTLIQAEKHYKLLLENSQDLIMLVTMDGTILYVSDSVTKILQYAPLDLIGENLYDYVRFKDTPQLMKILTEDLNHNTYSVHDQIFNIRNKSDNWLTMETSIKKINDKNNEAICFVFNSQNITKRINAEQALKLSEEKYRNLYDKALVGMITLDAKNGNVLACNELGAIDFGYSDVNSFIGKNFLTDHIDLKQQHDALLKFKTKKNLTNEELQFTRNDKSTFWASLTTKQYDHNNTIDMVIIDITKNKNTEQQVYELTFFDHLTKLPNKEMFRNRLQTEIIRGQRFAVMCIGISNFKNINEMYGPMVGDKLLRYIATELNDVYFKKDMVSRFAGDKYMILLSTIGSQSDEINVDNISTIAHKTIGIFSSPFNIQDHLIELIPYIGICLYPDDGSNAEELMRNSESAMYAAKDIGKSLFHYFDAGLNKLMKERISLETKIRKAIKDQEFEPFFQPKVNNTGALVGMESLIRWKPSNSTGFIPPVQFIPIAERNRSIIDIGYMILEKACRQNKVWQDNGYTPMRVAVNLSPYQFSHPDLIRNIINILDKIGLETKWIELEITESGIMENEIDTIEKLNQLHELGITISIDDFGTGYSSLNKLKNYPIDTLKIDKSFIEDLPDNKQAQTLATTIIDLAHNLGFKVVAEGVETTEQVQFLKEQYCDYYQGYFFYKPMPAEEFTNLLRSNKSII